MNKQKRVYHLDLYRFIAALSVVLFHYLFRGAAADNLSILNFGEVGEYFKYGYLGVDLFFIISGFVITLSIQHNSLIKFFVSRFTRLYPAYWLCVLITFTVMFLFGQPRFSASFEQLLMNLTMFQGYVGVENIDGVYWTLLVEMKFYFFIAFFLIISNSKKIRLDHLVLFWLFLSIMYIFFNQLFIFKVINYFLFLTDSSYFIAGILFFQIFTNGLKLKHSILLIICLPTSFYYGIIRIPGLENHFNTTFSPYIICTGITLFYLLLLLVSIHKLNFMNSPKFIKLGVLTYPLYLLHQNIGFIIFNELGIYIDKWILVFATILFIIVISHFISSKFESRISKALRKKMERFVRST